MTSLLTDFDSQGFLTTTKNEISHTHQTTSQIDDMERWVMMMTTTETST